MRQFTSSIWSDTSLWTIGNKNTTNRAHSRHQGLWSGRVVWQGFWLVGALSWQTHSRCPYKHSASSIWRRGQRQETSEKQKNKTEMLETTDIFNNININCIYTKHSLIWSSYTVFTSHVHQVSDHHKVSSSELKPQEECSLQQIWPVWPTVSHTVQGIVFLWQKLCL